MDTNTPIPGVLIETEDLPRLDCWAACYWSGDGVDSTEYEAEEDAIAAAREAILDPQFRQVYVCKFERTLTMLLTRPAEEPEAD